MVTRPPLPIELKKLKGTYRNREEDRESPQVEILEIPDAPDHLTDLEKKYWKIFKDCIDTMQVASTGDLQSFEMLVATRAAFELVRRADGLDVKQFVTLSKEVRSWLSVFGLSPSSRSSLIRLGKKQLETNELSEFLS